MLAGLPSRRTAAMASRGHVSSLARVYVPRRSTFAKSNLHPPPFGVSRIYLMYSGSVVVESLVHPLVPGKCIGERCAVTVESL